MAEQSAKNAKLGEGVDSKPGVKSGETFTLPTKVAAKIDRDHDNIEHDTFADEFIQSVGKISQANIVSRLTNDSQFTKKLVEENTAPPISELNLPAPNNTSKPVEIESPFSSTSLKMSYSPPTWPHQIPLYKTLSKLPALRSLILDDSKISWLRELGSSLPNLLTLSLMRCGLKSLDGTLGFPNLENLFAADNLIENPAPLSGLLKLRYVDLSNNPIENFQGFAFMSVCTNLRCIKLMETPVSRSNEFHFKLKQFIPSLREIQPKTREGHGDSIFDFYYSSPGGEAGLEVTSREGGDAGTRVSFANLNLDENLLENQAEDEGTQLTEADVGFEWGEEEKRLRDVYVPGRVGFHKRSGETRMAPTTVDEMDALLDELENCQPGENPLAAINSAVGLPQKPEPEKFSKKYFPTIVEENEVTEAELKLDCIPKPNIKPLLAETGKKLTSGIKSKDDISKTLKNRPSTTYTRAKTPTVPIPKVTEVNISKKGVKPERPKLPTTLKGNSETKKNPSMKK